MTPHRSNHGTPSQPRNRDLPDPVYNAAGLATMGAALLEGSRKRGEPLSLALFEFGELIEMNEIFGADIRRAVIGCIVERLRPIAGDKGLIARYGPIEFVLVVPDQVETQVRGVIEHHLGKTPCIAMKLERLDAFLAPEFAVSTAGVDDAASFESWHAELRAGLREKSLRERLRRSTAAAPTEPMPIG